MSSSLYVAPSPLQAAQAKYLAELEQDEKQPSAPVTAAAPTASGIGIMKIAIGVLVGNLLTGIAAGLVYMAFTAR